MIVLNDFSSVKNTKKIFDFFTSSTPSSDVLIDRERDSIALSIPSSLSISESK
jgi:hypothetical protein